MENFENYGVVSLDNKEMRETDGGYIRLLYAYLGAMAGEAVFDGLDQCLEDFKEGYNETRNN